MPKVQTSFLTLCAVLFLGAWSVEGTAQDASPQQQSEHAYRLQLALPIAPRGAGNIDFGGSLGLEYDFRPHPLHWNSVGFLGGLKFDMMALPSNNDAHNRIALGTSALIGFEFVGEGWSANIAIYGGALMGSSQAKKVHVTGLLGQGISMGFKLSPQTELIVGLDFWQLGDNLEAFYLAPIVGFGWE